MEWIEAARLRPRLGLFQNSNARNGRYTIIQKNSPPVNRLLLTLQRIVKWRFPSFRKLNRCQKYNTGLDTKCS